MSAFADFHVTLRADAPAPALARRDHPWRAAGAHAGAWSAWIAADAARGLVQTRTVAPWSVWLVGELARYDALAAPADPLGAFVLDLRNGKPHAAALDGHFVLFAWNADAREWHVWTDRFATMHAYVGHGARGAALGTFHPAVSRSVEASKLDWLGLSGFFAMGFFPEDRTHFEEVRIVRPATHLVCDARRARTREERYWQWHHDPSRAPAFDDAVDEFGARLARVLHAETARGRVAVPISGGLDSRTTVAMLAPADRPLWSYSYGYGAGSVETRIARRVAAARALPFDAFCVPEYLFDRMDDVLAATEGFNDITQSRQVGVSAEVAAHADAVIAAHWGDVWLDDTGGGGETAAAHKMMQGGRRWLLDTIAAPRLGADPEAEARGSIARELARIPAIPDDDFRLKAFKTDGWSFRWTSVGVRAFALGAFPRLPFYDSAMAEFFCTLPRAYVRDRRLQVEWLKRRAPDLARITWQAHDADLHTYRFANSLLLPKRALKKAWRLATGARVVERNWEVQLLSPAGRTRLRDALVSRGRRLHEFVSPAAIEMLLIDFFARPLEEKRGYTVSMLLTFSEWLERFA